MYYLILYVKSLNIILIVTLILNSFLVRYFKSNQLSNQSLTILFVEQFKAYTID